MIVQVSTINTDAESDNLMETTVVEGKTAAHAMEFPPRYPSV